MLYLCNVILLFDGSIVCLIVDVEDKYTYYIDCVDLWENAECGNV